MRLYPTEQDVSNASRWGCILQNKVWVTLLNEDISYRTRCEWHFSMRLYPTEQDVTNTSHWGCTKQNLSVIAHWGCTGQNVHKGDIIVPISVILLGAKLAFFSCILGVQLSCLIFSIRVKWGCIVQEAVGKLGWWSIDTGRSIWSSCLLTDPAGSGDNQIASLFNTGRWC